MCLNQEEHQQPKAKYLAIYLSISQYENKKIYNFIKRKFYLVIRPTAIFPYSMVKILKEIHLACQIKTMAGVAWGTIFSKILRLHLGHFRKIVMTDELFIILERNRMHTRWFKWDLMKVLLRELWAE